MIPCRLESRVALRIGLSPRGEREQRVSPVGSMTGLDTCASRGGFVLGVDGLAVAVHHGRHPACHGAGSAIRIPRRPPSSRSTRRPVGSRPGRGSRAQAGLAEVGQLVEDRDGAGGVVERVVVARALFEHCGDRDLGVVEPVLEQPPAAPGAMDTALVAAVRQATAGAGLDRQVDADVQQLTLLADAAHVLVRSLRTMRAVRRACGADDCAASPALLRPR